MNLEPKRPPSPPFPSEYYHQSRSLLPHVTPPKCGLYFLMFMGFGTWRRILTTICTLLNAQIVKFIYLIKV